VIVCRDNFLSTGEFQELNTCILNRFNTTLKEHTIQCGETFPKIPIQLVLNQLPIRTHLELVEEDEKEDYNRIHFLLGLPIVSSMKIIQEYMINELQIKKPKPSSVWIQYMHNKHRLGKHLDGAIRGRSLNKSLTSLLYAHEQWEDTWGGEFDIADHSYLPKPNRLIVYSRDNSHGVNPILHKNDNYYRLFLGVSWSSD
jgi:hypothetical protein